MLTSDLDELLIELNGSADNDDINVLASDYDLGDEWECFLVKEYVLPRYLELKEEKQSRILVALALMLNKDKHIMKTAIANLYMAIDSSRDSRCFFVNMWNVLSPEVPFENYECENSVLINDAWV